MQIQLLSDLHLETEMYDPRPQPGADLLVLAGDIDSGWHAYARFARWPVPVVVVAGNHEFDGRDLIEARVTFRAHCERHNLRLLERETLDLTDATGRRLRLLGATRWTDFDVFGADRREGALRAGGYFHRLMRARIGLASFDAEAARQEGLSARIWLEQALNEAQAAKAAGDIDTIVTITHFAPSLRSGDPRYGEQLSTACFCNADDDLFPLSDVWLHGHVHRRHDYVAEGCHVVSQARGLAVKGEARGFDETKLIKV